MRSCGIHAWLALCKVVKFVLRLALCGVVKLRNPGIMRSSFSTPPQAWQVRDRQPEVCHELPKLVGSYNFSEDVGRLKICANVLEVDITNKNALSNEVIVHFDMLCPRVEHRVPSQINIAHIVAVKGSWILDGYAQILDYPLEPCGHRCCRENPSLCADREAKPPGF